MHRDDARLREDFMHGINHLCVSILKWFASRLGHIQFQMVSASVPILYATFASGKRVPVLMVMHGNGCESLQWFHVLCFYKSIDQINDVNAKVQHSYLFQGVDTDLWSGHFECADKKWVPGCMRQAFNDLHVLLML
jgi:hypothetical protein